MTVPRQSIAGFIHSLAVLLALAWSFPLGAQEAPTQDVAQVLERGARLEQERQWADALTIYEEALRLHPERDDLHQRLVLVRSHYDVCRRYSDQTYTAALDTISERDATAIYDEVLQKISTHYVHEPNWQELFRRGTVNLEVALAEPAFIDRHFSRLGGPQRDQQVAAAKKLLREYTAAVIVGDKAKASIYLEQMARSFKQRFNLPVQATILEYACGAAGSLDDYSGFLTGSQMDEVFAQIEGNFVGLGVELKTEPSGLLIVNVIAGGPAAEKGIRPGERLIAVDGKTTKEMSPDALADLLRGEEGTAVRIEVLSNAKEKRELSVTRRRVEVPSVDEIRIVDKEYGVGYFKIASFQKTTPRDVEAALWKLHEQGMRSLIVDLRGNPGGLLKAAVDVADKFVMDGMIVATRGRSKKEDFDHKGQIAGTWRVPLVVLIDHDSASASEIFAGAIRDHRRGTVVGEKSYGKGSVQGIFPLATSNVGVRLTTAKWYTPSGHAISGQGVAPDIVVRTAARPVVADGDKVAEDAAAGKNNAASQPDDPILRSGLQVARSNLSRRP